MRPYNFSAAIGVVSILLLALVSASNHDATHVQIRKRSSGMLEGNVRYDTCSIGSPKSGSQLVPGSCIKVEGPKGSAILKIDGIDSKAPEGSVKMSPETFTHVCGDNGDQREVKASLTQCPAQLSGSNNPLSGNLVSLGPLGTKSAVKSDASKTASSMGLLVALFCSLLLQ
ncbi:hypothetical protein MP638_001780 [Amoeboaphelidium occidentale]|nr:hypothetical protein MP638_001780 [Amoeboaphelidium occidentale]